MHTSLLPGTALTSWLCAMLLLSCAFTATAPAQEMPENLLHATIGGKNPGWRFDAKGAAGLEATEANDPVAGKFLKVLIPAQANAQSWWVQEISAEPYATYTLRLKARAFGPQELTDRSAGIGVFFRDAEKKWLGYKELAHLAYYSPKWPGATKPDTKEWKDIEVSFTPPPGTATLGIRLNVGGERMEAGFAQISLTMPDRTVSQMLEIAPAQIPALAASLQPVSTRGQTITPDWSLADAAQTASATRRKVCLNGVWAMQPTTTAAVLKSAPQDWAFVKLPNRLRGSACAWAYGQDATSWKKEDWSRAPAFWLWREVTLPALPSGGEGRYAVSFGSLSGLAVKAYWNGQPVGTIEDAWGGRIELPAGCKPGEKGQLAVYALINQVQNETPHLIAAGKLKRPYRFQANMRPWTAEFGDLYLFCEPATEAARMSDLRISPSVRKHELSVTLPRTAIPAGATWRVRIKESGFSGKEVLNLPATEQAEDTRMRLTIPWQNPRQWNPDDPFLYELTLALVDAQGKDLDESLPRRFGFREMWVDGKRLVLNGQTLRLRPRMTFFSGSTGDIAAVRRSLGFLRQMGFNCWLRIPSMQSLEEEHAFSDALCDLADETGMMLVPYTPYQLVSGGQFASDTTRATDADLLQYVDSRLMSRIANHPSVIAISGFGTGLKVKNNPYNSNPDWFGVDPVDTPARVAQLREQKSISEREAELASASIDFVTAMKKLLPDRPFLSHYDCGMGDGWGTFDYFNWTPLQEWESWLRPWAERGVKPVGSWEHGLPYPMSFVNHGVPDGDGEPWVSEYAAARLGSNAYAVEPEEYRAVVRESYRQNKPAYNKGHWSTYWHLPGGGNPAGQLVWQDHNRRLYRAWRTYGVPMGLDPFGPASNYVHNDWLKKGGPAGPAADGSALKTPGIKADTWHYSSRWPEESAPALAPFNPQCLTPLGQALYENNQPLLVYLAGGGDFTDKAHVFRAGEAINKQVATVWDGFRTRRLRLQVSAECGGKPCYQNETELTVPGGEIRFTPITFPAPQLDSARAEGNLSLRVIDCESGATVATDRFAFQVYAPDPALPPLRIALFDPAGESGAMFEALGLPTRKVEDLTLLKTGTGQTEQLLVIGRKALPALRGQDLHALIPAGMPVLVLEQSDRDLEVAGLRAYPTRTRQVFPLPAAHAVLTGIAAPELCDWRASPRLFSPGTTPLRDGYNWRGDSAGTVASAVIEIPTRGNFTPLLQCEFDLAQTPLLHTQLDGRNWVFCQLSLIEGVAADPTAQRIARNLLRWLTSTQEAPTSRPLAILGDGSGLTDALALTSTSAAAKAAELPAQAVALVTARPDDPAALRRWVEAGGTALVLPLPDAADYAALQPQLHAVKENTAFAAPGANNTNASPLATDPLLRGLGRNDFHYRQTLPVWSFNGGGVILNQSAGSGRWVWIGFDPRALNTQDEPYLRLTWRRQCRALAQVLTNLGVDCPVAATTLRTNLHTPPSVLELSEQNAQWRLRAEPEVPALDWTTLAFSDQDWTPFDPAAKNTPHGHAQLRIAFRLPDGFSPQKIRLDAGTVDDFDECYLNGTLIGSTSPANYDTEKAWSRRRLYDLPEGLLKAGELNVLAVRAWNRNAETKGWKTIIRGPFRLQPQTAAASLYAGPYRHCDDPYFEYHW